MPARERLQRRVYREAVSFNGTFSHPDSYLYECCSTLPPPLQFTAPAGLSRVLSTGSPKTTWKPSRQIAVKAKRG